MGQMRGKFIPVGIISTNFVEGKFDDENPYTKSLKRVAEKQIK